MLSNKLNLWLRLDEGFFRERAIKKMRRLENGADNIIIYQKLMLLSIDNEGCLIFTGHEESMFEQLSIEIDEREESIKETIDFCIKNSLMVKAKMVQPKKDNDYILTEVSELLMCDGYCYLGD